MTTLVGWGTLAPMELAVVSVASAAMVKTLDFLNDFADNFCSM
jgi:hypothetical protein